MKILLLCGKSTTVVWFRRTLIKELQARGCSVSVVALDDERREDIEEYGVDFYALNDSNRSTNPLKILTLASRYATLVRQISPDVVCTFMLKPNIFGTLGAKKAGVKNIYSMVEGAGDVFIYNTLKWKLIRKFVCVMYKQAFKYSKKVFFLNNDDKDEFIDRGLVCAEQCEIIPGIGVDLDRFSYTPVKNYRTFIMIARMLKTKGVMEFCEAARKVKVSYPDAIFNLIGPEGTVTQADIQEYIDDGSVNYLGQKKDVRPYIEEASVNILPSYREGLGLVNAEAGAVGRPSITCNTIGTKETVKDGYNGFLVKVADSDEIAEKAIYFIENPDKVELMGKNSRQLVEDVFDYNVINAKICKIINAPDRV